MKREFLTKLLPELNAPKYDYNGKKLTEYEASQQQRYNERQIRRWKREEAAMQAAGLDSSEATGKVKEWQARQRDFIEQTGFKRQYGREQTGFKMHIVRDEVSKTKFMPSPTTASTHQEIKKTPVNVLSEYMDNATPGVGEIVLEEGYKVSGHKAEIEMAQWLHDTFGGDIRLLKEPTKDGVKSPDYIWNGSYWELKGISSINSADKSMQHAIKQIQSNPGGVILDLLSEADVNAVVNQVTRRVSRSKITGLDVMIVKQRNPVQILRYKK